MNSNLVPADFFDENKVNWILEKSFSSRTFKAVLPTKPVAPTIATLYFFA